jgi:hypothetical protein
MMNTAITVKKNLPFLLVFSLFVITRIHGQAVHYNLVTLLKDGKLVTTAAQHTQALPETERQGIATQGLVWLSKISFKEGTIDIDLRGKDVFLQSFLGIAFYGRDSLEYDVIYFRPFNFNHADTSRRKWSVQYMSLPKYDYAVLRKAHPQEYENSVNPVPRADDWFHATLVIGKGWVTTYVNHSKTPSLKVSILSTTQNGKIGLWADGLSGDFSNLVITEKN